MAVRTKLRDAWEFNTEVQLFANRGYAVLQVNYRGSAGYGRVFQELGLPGVGRQNDRRHRRNATRDVIDNGEVDRGAGLRLRCQLRCLCGHDVIGKGTRTV